jgi:hypothetical protein
MVNPLPELTLTPFHSWLNSRKRTKNLGSGVASTPCPAAVVVLNFADILAVAYDLVAAGHLAMA